MLFSLLFSLALTLALTMPLASTPVSLGLWIIMFAMTLASSISFMTSTWFGLILFIIYIGGMLVMFSYFAAITPNQKINLSSIFFIISLAMITFMISMPSWITLNSMTVLTPSTFFSIPFLYYPKQTSIIITMAILLLLALIFVVKIAQRSEGPLRPFKL